MKFIKPFEELYGLVPLFNKGNILECMKFIEKCGRTCYKSEDRITDDSCIKFVGNILDRKHLTVPEHSNLVIRIKYNSGLAGQLVHITNTIKIIKSDYMVFDYDDQYVYLSGNIRSWMELLDVYGIREIVDASWGLVNRSLPNFEIGVSENNINIPQSLRRYTVKFTHDRAFSHELVRHRLCVFSQESQRYVRYDDDAVFIVPFQYRKMEIPQRFVDYIQGCENEYRFQRIEEKQPPELARTGLPNCTKTEVVTTADNVEWNHIFKLRHANTAHPDMRDSMGRIIDTVTTEIRM